MTNWNIPMWIVCVTLFLFVLTACSPTTKIVCPRLAPPPASTVDALEKAGRQDPSSAAWVIDLDRHYQKLDRCR